MPIMTEMVSMIGEIFHLLTAIVFMLAMNGIKQHIKVDLHSVDRVSYP
jgi:hypothetical protein